MVTTKPMASDDSNAIGCSNRKIVYGVLHYQFTYISGTLSMVPIAS